jgi:hypothetical protein
MTRRLTRNISYITNSGDISEEELNHIFSDVLNGLRSRQDIERIFNVSKSEANKKIKKFRQNQSIYTSVGRPPALDLAAKDKLIDTLQELRQVQSTATKKEMKQLFYDCKKETLEREGKSTYDCQISKSTIKRYRRGLDIRQVQGQSTTTARQRAILDPRNFISSAIMHYSIAEGLIPEMIFNFDATSFKISTKDDYVYFAFDEEDDTPVTRVSDDGLDIFVKVIVCHNAGGELGPLTFVIADKKIEDIQYYEINSSCNPPKDRIIFAASRGGNQEIYSAYMNDTMIPFIRKIKEQNADIGVDSSCMTVDGELQQIEAILDPFIMNQFIYENIRVGKSAASCSNTVQASDVSPLFRNAKSRADTLDDVYWENTALEARIRNILEEQNYSTVKRDKLTCGLLKIIASFRNTATPYIIKQGYLKSGLYPLNYQQTMSQCKQTVSKEEQDIIDDKFEDLLDIFNDTGELTEADMDEAGIVSVVDTGRTKIPKDERVLIHQRAVELTHKSIMKRYIHKNESSSDTSNEQDANDDVDDCFNIFEEDDANLSHHISSRGRIIKRKRY